MSGPSTVWDAIYTQDGDVFPDPHEDMPRLAETLPQRGAGDLLDLGCGTGRHLAYVARCGFAVAGLDGAPAGLALAKRKLRTPGLAADLRCGDIYTEYSAAIHTYVYNLLTNREDADDVTQEVFIRVHAHLGQLRDPERLKSWLYRIATNLCMDHLRRRSRVRRVLGVPLSLTPFAEDGEQQMSQEIEQPGSTAAIDGVAERDHIVRALQKMPPKYAAYLLLHSVQGLSYREIADVLGITPGAAAVRLTRARDLFGRYYDELRGGEQP